MTQKEIIRTHKEAARLYVVTFHELTGARVASYGGLDPFRALSYIIQQQYLGRKVVVTDGHGDGAIMLFENAQKRRIGYHEAVAYRITLKNDLTLF